MPLYIQYPAIVGPPAVIATPASTPDQWMPYGPQRRRQRRPRQDFTTAPTPVVAAPPVSTPDQWTPYGPTRYRRRRARQDLTADPIRQIPGTACDDFNRANGGLGANWSTVFQEDPHLIVNESVQGTQTDVGATSIFTAISWPDDQFSRIEVVECSGGTPGMGTGLIAVLALCRGDISLTAKTYYNFGVRSPLGPTATVFIQRVVADVFDTLAVTSTSVEIGDTVELRCVGTTLTGYVNGVLVIGPVTDTAIASGAPGFRSYALAPHPVSNAILDHWCGGAAAFQATAMENWMPPALRSARLQPAHRDLTTQPLSDVAAPVSTPDQWTPYGPTQYRLRRPQRDGTADVRISGFEATSLTQWQALDWRQTRLRPPLRDMSGQTVQLVPVQASTPDQWTLYGPTQYRVRRPQRDLTADVRISGFEATSLDQWQALDWRQYRVRPPLRDMPGQTVQLVSVVPATSPEQWTPYGPTQYRMRGANRDMNVFMHIIGIPPEPPPPELFGGGIYPGWRRRRGR